MEQLNTLPKEVLETLLTRNPTIIKSALGEMGSVYAQVNSPCYYEGVEGGPLGYHLCEHPDEPLGMWVCRCKGCGPRCSGYQSTDLFGPVNKRHLIYHVLPVGQNGLWQRGVDELRKRWHLFNGRKIIAILKGKSITEQVELSELSTLPARTLPIDPPHVVKDYLPKDCEIIELDNDSSRWELTSWQVRWDTVLYEAHPQDAILYAHAKGVTRRPNSSCQNWAKLLYELSLDYWPVVEELFRRYPIVGSLVKKGRWFPPPLNSSEWHFHGNFFWARAGDIRQRLLHTKLPNHRWSTEAWAGMAYRKMEVGEVFSPQIANMFLYNPFTMAQVTNQYSTWKLKFKPISLPML